MLLPLLIPLAFILLTLPFLVRKELSLPEKEHDGPLSQQSLPRSVRWKIPAAWSCFGMAVVAWFVVEQYGLCLGLSLFGGYLRNSYSPPDWGSAKQQRGLLFLLGLFVACLALVVIFPAILSTPVGKAIVAIPFGIRLWQAGGSDWRLFRTLSSRQPASQG